MLDEPVAICAVMVGGVRCACVLRKFHVGDVVSHGILKRCRRRLTPAFVTLRPRVALCVCVVYCGFLFLVSQLWCGGDRSCLGTRGAFVSFSVGARI